MNKKRTKILVFGYFGKKSNIQEGQSVKTRNMSRLFKEMGCNVEEFDTESFRYDKLAIFKMIRQLYKCEKLCLLPAYNNLKFFFPILFVFSKLFRYDIYLFTIGGRLHIYLKSLPIHRWMMRRIKCVFNETHLLGNYLHNIHGYTNLEYCPNIKFISFTPQKYHTDGDSFKAFYGRNAVLINNGRSVDSSIEISNDVRDEITGYKKSDKTKIIIQLARFQSQKNIPMMARVANRLYSEGYDFSLLFIGSTENKPIVDEVKSMMPPCAHILGERNNPLEYLKEADAFALSSLFEGMPISLLEALAVGAVPVCTPVGGIPNAVIDGENGFLSTDNKEASYYEAMKRFLETDMETLNTMSLKAKQSFAPYSMEECAGKYLQLYKNLIRNKKK